MQILRCKLPFTHADLVYYSVATLVLIYNKPIRILCYFRSVFFSFLILEAQVALASSFQFPHVV